MYRQQYVVKYRIDCRGRNLKKKKLHKTPDWSVSLELSYLGQVRPFKFVPPPPPTPPGFFHEQLTI